MTECEEVAERIFNALKPGAIKTYSDAEWVARLSVGDQGQTIRDNVAEALWQLVQKEGRHTQ